MCFRALVAALVFLSSLGLAGEPAYAGRKELVWDGSKWVYRVVRDGVVYDGLKAGGGYVKKRVQNRKICKRVYDTNSNSNSTPARLECWWEER